MTDLSADLLSTAVALMNLRKKPTTQERYQQYPALLQRFNEQLAQCSDPALLKQVIDEDDGYFLLAGYRQRVIEKLLQFERTAEHLRLYRMQLMLFGDVDEWGEANTDVEDRLAALESEADALDTASGPDE